MNIQNKLLNSKAKFLRYRKGIAYYAVSVPYSEKLYSFPVPVNTMQDEVLFAEKNSLYFMKHIQQAIHDGTLVKEAA